MKKTLSLILVILVSLSGMAWAETAEELMKKSREAVVAEDYDKAIDYCKKSIEMKPDYQEAYDYMGLIYGKKGDFEKAISWYKKAIAINPKFEWTYINLGFFYKERGMLDDAIGEFKKAITLSDAETNKMLCLELGNIYHEKGMYPDAVFNWKKGTGYGDDPEVHYNIGVALNEMGKADEAIAEYKKAIEIDPDYASAHYNLGLAYYKKGLNVLAADYFYSAGLLLIKHGHGGHAFLAYEDLKKVESTQRISNAPSSEIIKTKRLVDNLFNALQPDLQKKKGNPSK
jgi:tetratricopeptide (TPR) repeat protein